MADTNEEILKTIKEKGLLLEKEVFDLLQSFQDAKIAKNFLENLERISGQKIITKSVLNKNLEYVRQLANRLEGESKHSVESVIVKLGLSLEITKKKEFFQGGEEKKDSSNSAQKFQVFYADTRNEKKLEVADFTGHFRARYQQLQRILMQRAGLQNLMSIGKISGERQQLSIIGIVKEKRMTKNKNLIIGFEDLTGEISALAKVDRADSYTKAEELQLDDVVAVKASGNRDILFIYDIYFPEAHLPQRTTFSEEDCVAFLSDIHAGGGRHLGKSFENFLGWLQGDNESAKKIKYIFFVGDNVDGVGIFPGQEHLLELKSMKEQYELLASYLKKVPKHITMFMCPGQHDATRVAEPQPLIDKKYASALYNIENLVLVTNPCLVKLLEGEKEFKILMYHGASIHGFINEISELRIAKAHKCPAKAIRHMLKRRHLAPSHSSVVYIPNAEKDPLVIGEVPDVLCTGEVHRSDIENYNGILIITGSCWQAQTDFEEKVGNMPDPGKVPVLNLKTRELKIFDFLDEEELRGK